MVSVIMLTYNHEKFIVQAIEGVLMQQTSFPVTLYLADDASIDNTSAICSEYALKFPDKIVHLLNENNKGSRLNYINALKRCSSKYIANCEGDDYWTDPNKLQKQVNFLEANPDYSICWTRYKILKEAGSYKDKQPENPDWISMLKNEEKIDVDLSNIFNPYATYTLTVMFKKDSINYQLFSKMKYAKDNSVYCMCLSKGKGAILNFCSGVYRVHGSGIFSGLNIYNRCYSNFQNVNEIIRKSPGCNNSNLKAIRNAQLLEAFEICLKDRQLNHLPKLLNIYFKILVYFKPADKLNTSKILLKQIKLLMKTANRKPGKLVRPES